MALKVLLMRNKAATKKKLLEELRSKDEGFQTREQELERPSQKWMKARQKQTVRS